MINLTKIVYINKDYAPNNRVEKNTLDIDADEHMDPNKAVYEDCTTI